MEENKQSEVIILPATNLQTQESQPLQFENIQSQTFYFSDSTSGVHANPLKRYTREDEEEIEDEQEELDSESMDENNIFSSNFNPKIAKIESETIEASDDAPNETFTNRSSLEDDSFMDLISHFATLHTNETNRVEQCPLCTLEMLLPDFAPHVLECIKVLDAIEQKQIEQIDEQVAFKLAEADGSLYSQNRFKSQVQQPTSAEGEPDEIMSDNDEHHHSQAAAASSEQSMLMDMCPDGNHCVRKDANHFVRLKHPSLPCPICNQNYPPYEINAHLNFCLNSKDTNRISDVAPVSLQASQSIRDENVNLGIELNSHQASALARELLLRRDKISQDGGSSTTNHDELGVCDLLESFKQLGFTSENLSKLKQSS